MSIFSDWLEKKKLLEDNELDDDPASKFKFNQDADFAQDCDMIKKDLFNHILSKYPEETNNFFQAIAIRGDEEVAYLLSKLNRGGGNILNSMPTHPKEKDEVMPFISDRGFNPEE